MLTREHQQMALSICSRLQARSMYNGVPEPLVDGQMRADVSVLLTSLGMYADTTKMDAGEMTLMLVAALIFNGAFPIQM